MLQCTSKLTDYIKENHALYDGNSKEYVTVSAKILHACILYTVSHK